MNVVFFMSNNKYYLNIYLMIAWFFFFVFVINSMPDFGMNKPHHLFHLGDRSQISQNIGWGYWF